MAQTLQFFQCSCKYLKENKHQALNFVSENLYKVRMDGTLSTFYDLRKDQEKTLTILRTRIIHFAIHQS